MSLSDSNHTKRRRISVEDYDELEAPDDTNIELNFDYCLRNKYNNDDSSTIMARDIFSSAIPADYVSDNDNWDIDSFSSPSKLKVSTETFLKAMKRKSLNRPKQNKIAREIAASLRSPDRDADMTPAEYWRRHGSRHPYLYSLASSIASCPATSCRNESIFAIAGKIKSPDRSLLTHAHFEMLVMISVNSKYMDMIRDAV